MLSEAVENGHRYSGESVRVREARHDWRTIDRALRSIARRRGELDAEEACWLREAEAQQIWRPLGMVSALDYLERALGYGPRAAHDRLRIARALGVLPELTAALASGELAYSAIRELTRVVTPATEAAWRARATGKNLRQVEQLVAGHKPGDDPDDAPDPEVQNHVVRFELSADTYALLRQARGVVNDAHGRHIDDNELVAALCSAVLDGAGSATAEPTGRARFQIAMTVCERCKQGWQHGGGALIPVNSAVVERAECDAQNLGSLDDAIPARVARGIPPSVARLVWHRDHGRCRVPGCRSSLGLDLHHLVHRADGGSHDASNIILACGACHLAHHDGRLTISGTADQLEVTRAGERGAIHGAAHETDAAPAPCRQDACAADCEVSATRSTHVGTAHETDAAPAPCRQDACAADCEVSATRSTHVGTAHDTGAAHPSCQPDAPAEDCEASAQHASTIVARQTRAHAHASCGPDACAQDSEASAPARAPNASNGVAQQAGVHVGLSHRGEPDVGERAGARPDARCGRAPEADAAATPGACMLATPGEASRSEASPVDLAAVSMQLEQTLVQLGWKLAIARRSVAAATAALGAHAPFEQLVREALRRCLRPSA